MLRPKLRVKSRREHNHDILRDWEAKHPGETIDFDMVAAEAIRKGWRPKSRTMRQQCAVELAQAARRDFIEDSAGPVRRYHAAPYKRGDKILYLWQPIETADETHMRRSVQSRRNGAEADLMQLRRDVEFWNRNNKEGKALQLDLNFELDAAERDMPVEYPDAPENN